MNELSIPFPDLGMSDTTQEWLVEKPVMIVVYVLLALAVRWLLHRGIDRVTTPTTDGTTPRLMPRRRRKTDVGTTIDVEEHDDERREVSADESGGLTAESLKSTRRKPAEQAMSDRKRAERRAQRMATIGSVLKSLVSFVVLVWVVLQTLAILGVNVAPFIASAGIVGVALGSSTRTRTPSAPRRRW